MDKNMGECLAKYVEQISDGFASTFTVVDDNTLANMMSVAEIKVLTEIIKKYLPDSELDFKCINQLTGGKDIYTVRATTCVKNNTKNSITTQRRKKK